MPNPTCYSMSMLKERLQVLIDRDQRLRLEREAAARGTSVATLVREAIDVVFPSTSRDRAEAAERILAEADMDVPGDIGDMLTELETIRGRRT